MNITKLNSAIFVLYARNHIVCIALYCKKALGLFAMCKHFAFLQLENVINCCLGCWFCFTVAVGRGLSHFLFVLYIIYYYYLFVRYILLSLAPALHTNDACDELGALS